MCKKKQNNNWQYIRVAVWTEVHEVLKAPAFGKSLTLMSTEHADEALDIHSVNWYNNPSS